MSERGAQSQRSSDSHPPGRRASRLPRRRQPLPIDEACAGLHACCVAVEVEDVVFVKGIIEASDGLAAVFAERGGDLVIATPAGRHAELSELLDDLARDIGAKLAPHPTRAVAGETGKAPARSAVPTDMRRDND